MINMHVVDETYSVGSCMAAEQPREIWPVTHKSAVMVLSFRSGLMRRLTEPSGDIEASNTMRK